jgi:poly(3-hydroxybutyrate) depolymerase
MRSIYSLLIVLPLHACTGASSDTATGEDQAQDDLGPQPAALASLSSGQCPDLSETGSSTFLSSDEERNVHMVIPEDLPQDAPVIFFFHGLLDPGHTPDPAEYMANALGMQSLADEYGAVMVLPVSPIMSQFGMSFFMWDVMEETDTDVVLFDDLRTCISDELGVDLKRLSLMGFSGGSLFATTLARERSDTIATIVEMSGGADLDVSIFENPLSRYETPEWEMPMLLISGGESDVWPDSSFALVNFYEATNTLQDNRVADGLFSVRCDHGQGHTVTTQAYQTAKSWILTDHVYGEASPYETDGIADFESWCEVAE